MTFRMDGTTPHYHVPLLLSGRGVRLGTATVTGAGHPHTFIRSGQDVRTTAVTVAGRGPAQRAWVVSGLRDLVVLKSTGPVRAA